MEQGYEYRLSIEDLSEGVAILQESFDEDGKLNDFIFLQVNSAFEQLTGLFQKQIIGKKASDILAQLGFPVENWISLCNKERIKKEKIHFKHYFKPINLWLEIIAYFDHRNLLIIIFRIITPEKKEFEEISIPEKKEINQKLRLSDIIDISVLQSFLFDFYKLTEIRINLLDVEGRTLVSVGDEDICRQFHLVHPETYKYCQESNIQLTKDIPEGTFKAYKCKNNLWDIATPVVVEGKTLGNLFLGQFFYEDEVVDYDLFRSQAQRYGFDENEYLAALDRVPRFNRDRVQSALTFMHNLAHNLSIIGYGNVKLSKILAERNCILKELQESEERYRATLYSIGDAVISTDSDGCIINLNSEAEKIIGWKAEEVRGNEINQVFRIIDEKSRVSRNDYVVQALHGRDGNNLGPNILLIDRNGFEKLIDGSVAPIQDKTGKVLGAVLVFRDQTQNRAMNKKLQIMNAAIQSSANAIAFADLHGFITYVNPASLRLWGYEKEEEVLGWRVTNFFLIEESEAIKITNEIKQKGNFFGELIGKKKDGSHFDVQISATLVTDENGQSYCMMGSFVDITEQKRIEKALAEEAKRRRILIDQSRDGIVVMDGEGGVFEANQKFAEMLGYTMDEVSRLHVWEWDAKISQDRLLEMIQSVTEEGDHFETQHRRKDGSLIDVEISTNAAFFGGKKLIFCVCHDITERKKMEEELRREQALLRTFINHIPDPAYVKDLHARKLLANQADLENMGLKKEEEALGKTDFEIFPHHVAEHFYRDDMYVLRNGKPILNREERLVRPNGEERWFLSSKIPLFDEKGQVIGLVGIGRDITERKNAEERIHYLSFHDSLTGLYNRAYLEEEIKRLDTERQLPIGIIMMDVNGLKLFNDAYGHRMGDQLLKTAADVLRRICRKEDLIARWGGDEFIVFLPKTTFDEVEIIRKRIIDECNKTQIGTISLPLSMAIGVCMKEKSEIDINKVFREAEDRMYQNKLTESRSTRSTILSALRITLREKSQVTEEQVTKIQNLARIFGEAVNLTPFDQDRLALLVALQDIGSITLPEEILNKTSPLTDEEWSLFCKHPENGYRIARSIDELAGIAELILTHHENWDGSGFPQGLKGEEIPFLSRLSAIITTYDEMTRKNKFNQEEVYSKTKALKKLKSYAGKQFDPKLVNLFIDRMKNLPE